MYCRDCKCHHWFSLWLEDIRQQAMDWAKVDRYLLCHSASQEDQNKQKKNNKKNWGTCYCIIINTLYRITTMIPNTSVLLLFLQYCHNKPQWRALCVCVVYLVLVNEHFLVRWTNACTERKRVAAGLGWPCWRPCGWENRCWAKISIKSGKAPG